MPQEQEQQDAAASAPSAEAATVAPSSGSGAPAEPDVAALPDMVLFRCKEAYVYRVPPATTVGHRAELWDVNKWLATVSLRVVQADDDAYVRLLDEKTGELFAECPVPTDKPLQTAIEPVIDSSRYFVLRIVDRASGRHAFIGVGFRERSEASDFNAALHEFLQYIKRKRTAEAMRHAYEERLQSQASAGSESSEAASPLAPLPDLSIKEGETLRLRINAPKMAGMSSFVSGAGARRGVLNKNFSLIMDGHGGTIAALSSPSPGSSPKVAMSVSPSLEAGGGSPSSMSGTLPARLPRVSGAGDAELQARLQGLHLAQRTASASADGGSASASAASSSMATAGGADDDDGFGDFEVASAAPEAAAAAVEGGNAAPSSSAVQQAAPS
ncbi:hypothetical protein COHA_004710 [Chlorella ohadii]|uniref:NECAP PHear domain-containing protein n=1 Tax=Chlorella ohadii TaxID=2649997 RepID=A0AAD5DSD3_9CHLO|nr:hypothetical protein COHA_010781 [Chlorella ohadii]KAI7841539.1 hypothetical protein COHA_004710 [Chlorella ohadii]